MDSRFVKLKNLGSFRRFTLANWKAPIDPSVYIHLQADFTFAQAYIDDLNRNHEGLVTIVHFVSKAMALVMKKYPQLNAVVVGGNIYLRKTIDMYINIFLPAKSLGGKSELAGGKIENCDEKSLLQIANEARVKAQLVRSGNDDGTEKTQRLLNFVPTFLLSFLLWLVDFLTLRMGLNLQFLGLRSDFFGSCLIAGLYKYNNPTTFTALLPFTRWGVILCINSVLPKPWIVGDKVMPRPVLDIGITGDHRLLDGSESAMACNYLKEILENPKIHMQ